MSVDGRAFLYDFQWCDSHFHKKFENTVKSVSHKKFLNAEWRKFGNFLIFDIQWSPLVVIVFIEGLCIMLHFNMFVGILTENSSSSISSCVILFRFLFWFSTQADSISSRISRISCNCDRKIPNFAAASRCVHFSNKSNFFNNSCFCNKVKSFRGILLKK